VTVNLGKGVTGSRPATKHHVSRIATMTRTVVAAVGGGGVAAIARTVAAVARVAGAWSASKVNRSSPTMTYSCPRAASWTCWTTTPSCGHLGICPGPRTLTCPFPW
jgi:hypothetical protein